MDVPSEIAKIKNIRSAPRRKAILSSVSLIIGQSFLWCPWLGS